VAPDAAKTDVQLLWVGSVGGMEQALVARAGIPYLGISTGQLRVADPLRVARNLGRMAGGVRQSLAAVDRFRPDVCFVTGGYVCGPVVLACALRKVPVLIYLPDITPGYAIRRLSKFARRVAVTFPEVARWFGGLAPQGKAVVTGYPVREELVTAAQERPAARRRLATAMATDLGQMAGAGLPLVLVWGGSQGARAINQATWEALPDILAYAHVVHVVGTRDWPLYQEWAGQHALPTAVAGRYHPVAYLHEEMPLALAAADLTVARAGASTLGEFPVARLPAILAPYEGVNQMDNAVALAERGCAVIVTDAELPTRLAPTVVALLTDPARRRQMEQALAALAQPAAALHIAEEIVALGLRGLGATYER
jgi:UDP-N-acetylglucosamine--N-acetylmuramyl-(pentapeptide) pyrophosphoryl-undecaprenol N-acetylglucosamine transferase